MHALNARFKAEYFYQLHRSDSGSAIALVNYEGNRWNQSTIDSS